MLGAGHRRRKMTDKPLPSPISQQHLGRDHLRSVGPGSAPATTASQRGWLDVWERGGGETGRSQTPKSGKSKSGLIWSRSVCQVLPGWGGPLYIPPEATTTVLLRHLCPAVPSPLHVCLPDPTSSSGALHLLHGDFLVSFKALCLHFHAPHCLKLF